MWAAVLIAMILFLVAAPSPVAAQTLQYVSDQLEITLRSGPGTNFAIRRMLKSGTPVQVLEDNGEGYARATTADGTTGWVLSRFLTAEPIARDRLAENEQQMQNMRQESALAQERLIGLEQLEGNLSRVQAEKENLLTELQNLKLVAADSLKIIEENKGLKQELEESSAKQQALIEENTRLGDESTQNWFLIGAGVLILGMLIGLTIPNIRWKKRRSSMSGINIDF
jgi:SH3 domain protein